MFLCVSKKMKKFFFPQRTVYYTDFLKTTTSGDTIRQKKEVRLKKYLV